MITENELLSAIAECQGERHPNANTCYKLAAFYALKDRLYPGKKETSQLPETFPEYSFSPDPNKPPGNTYQSGTEFARIIEGVSMDHVLSVIDELLLLLREINRPLYKSVLRKIKE